MPRPETLEEVAQRSYRRRPDALSPFAAAVDKWRPAAELLPGDLRALKGLLRDLEFEDVRNGMRCAEAAAHLAAWHVLDGRRVAKMTVEDFISPDVILEWGEELGGVPEGTRGEWVGGSNRISRLVVPRAWAAPRAYIRRTEHVAPQPDTTTAEWLEIAGRQRDPRVRWGLTGFIACARGAAIPATDMRALHPRRDFTVDLDGIVTAEIRGGRNPRPAVFNDRYAPIALEVMERLGDGPILPNPDAKNAVNRLWGQASGGAGLETPTDRRLIAAWVVEQMTRRVPVAAIFRQLGVRNSHILTDLLRYVPPFPDQEMRRWLAGRA